MEVHLIDGTYELFRHFYAVPQAKDAEGNEVGAVRGVLQSIRNMLRGGAGVAAATHIGVATDHVIESFRNRLWPQYKDGSGIDPLLWAQFPLLEEVLTAFGVVVWPMVEYEADDALAAAALEASKDKRVERVIICTPDKDLAQCVRGTRIVQLDRRKMAVRDEAEVVARFGVSPASIPDYLALVGDSADGYPGLKGWGAKSAAAILSAFEHLEAIPEDVSLWPLKGASAKKLAGVLREERERAFVFRDLATLRTDIPVFESVDELKWKGPTPAFAAIEARLKAAKVVPRKAEASGTTERS
jgi:5'-3' exonuclease